MTIRTWAVGFVLCAVALTSGRTDTVYVASPLTHTEHPDAAANSYSNWTYAATNLQAAITLAAGKSPQWTNVVVSNGVYGLTGTVTISHGAVLRSCNALGATDPAGTLLDGGGSVRCLRLNHADSVVDGFTITGGYDAVSGGGLSISMARLVTNCIVVGNTADGGTGTGTTRAGGGGIHVDFNTGVVTLSDLLVSNNTAAIGTYYTQHKGGGGVLVSSTNKVVIRSCTIANNNSHNSFGGGVAAGNHGLEVNVSLYDCTICGNTSTSVLNNYGGGGVTRTLGTLGTVSLEGCVLSNNTANRGGGG